MPSNLPMIGLRLPLALKQAAEKAAVADHRSLNNWLLTLIKREVSRMTQTQRYETRWRCSECDHEVTLGYDSVEEAESDKTPDNVACPVHGDGCLIAENLW